MSGATSSLSARSRRVARIVAGVDGGSNAVIRVVEAMDRVSSFLEPPHFFDPLHQQIFETAGKIIHAGKNATPITLRTFFERAEPISPNLTVPQYLGTLAANATTIINAEDYGRTVYDLATRRALIIIGEDMVTGAYDSPVDFTPQTQIQEAETRLGALSKGAISACGCTAFGVPRAENPKLGSGSSQTCFNSSHSR